MYVNIHLAMYVCHDLGMWVGVQVNYPNVHAYPPAGLKRVPPSGVLSGPGAGQRETRDYMGFMRSLSLYPPVNPPFLRIPVFTDKGLDATRGGNRCWLTYHMRRAE